MSVMESELLQRGFELMLVGMGTVFTFLTVLVIAMNLMSRLAVLIEPNDSTDSPSAEEVAAITSAIARYRNKS